MAAKLIHLDGKRFGNWTVSGRDEGYIGRKVKWQCFCDCGTTRSVYGHDLRSGKSRSCGCLDSPRNTRHGMTGTRLHRIWLGMQSRCKSAKHKSAASYFEKGIAVCSEWLTFEAFHDWAKRNGYDDGLTIDRIDNDLGYMPSNCRWANAETQSANRSVVRLTGSGRPGYMVAAENGIKQATYKARLRKGWSVDEAATVPSCR